MVPLREPISPKSGAELVDELFKSIPDDYPQRQSEHKFIHECTEASASQHNYPESLDKFETVWKKFLNRDREIRKDSNPLEPFCKRFSMDYIPSPKYELARGLL